MVGACQQNSGIFLVRGGGLDEMPTEGWDWNKMPRTKSPGLAAGSERDAGGPESGGSRT